MQYASWLAAYEAQVLAEAAGIELAKLAEVIRASDKMIGGASTAHVPADGRPFTPDDDAGIVGAMRSRLPPWPTRTCAPPGPRRAPLAWTCRWRH